MPFLSINKRSTLPFAPIHVDLWGPSLVYSKSGYHYYAYVINDFTRFTWLILLKPKSDFYHQFLLFEKFVDQQFSAVIKTVQCDGGG